VSDQPPSLRVRLTATEAAALFSGNLTALLAAEERHGGQTAAIEAEPRLAVYAPILQSIRAKLCAGALGIELRGDGRPFPPEVVADAARVLRAIIVSPDDPHPLA
jgi:hypothetical protein